ncbi:hypothetical protein GALMADRAFT_1352536 [Galerina marginata CBS 339.88]|uniref:Uncharacterized protein n=1 Tax=Galerina marginata (strain CBS 339.88) TaxID=685588 RepID=A0A067SHP7_GALM3|nr:hypothetical protein GALMADRAFT_1352536 [Galerina marginata CBS 339.88]
MWSSGCKWRRLLLPLRLVLLLVPMLRYRKRRITIFIETVESQDETKAGDTSGGQPTDAGGTKVDDSSSLAPAPAAAGHAADDPSSNLNLALNANPIVFTIETKPSGWSSFFSSRSLMVETLGYRSSLVFSPVLIHFPMSFAFQSPEEVAAAAAIGHPNTPSIHELEGVSVKIRRSSSARPQLLGSEISRKVHIHHILVMIAAALQVPFNTRLPSACWTPTVYYVQDWEATVHAPRRDYLEDSPFSGTFVFGLCIEPTGDCKEIRLAAAPCCWNCALMKGHGVSFPLNVGHWLNNRINFRLSTLRVFPSYNLTSSCYGSTESELPCVPPPSACESPSGGGGGTNARTTHLIKFEVFLEQFAVPSIHLYEALEEQGCLFKVSKIGSLAILFHVPLVPMTAASAGTATAKRSLGSLCASDEEWQQFTVPSLGDFGTFEDDKDDTSRHSPEVVATSARSQLVLDLGYGAVERLFRRSYGRSRRTTGAHDAGDGVKRVRDVAGAGLVDLGDVMSVFDTRLRAADRCLHKNAAWTRSPLVLITYVLLIGRQTIINMNNLLYPTTGSDLQFSSRCDE